MKTGYLGFHEVSFPVSRISSRIVSIYSGISFPATAPMPIFLSEWLRRAAKRQLTEIEFVRIKGPDP